MEDGAAKAIFHKLCLPRYPPYSWKVKDDGSLVGRLSLRIPKNQIILDYEEHKFPCLRDDIYLSFICCDLGTSVHNLLLEEGQD